MMDGGTYRFDALGTGWTTWSWAPGEHNVWNASAASYGPERGRVAGNCGRSAFVRRRYRRFQVHNEGPKAVYVDDYAHHPGGLAAAIGSARELYRADGSPGVPTHPFSRTRVGRRIRKRPLPGWTASFCCPSILHARSPCRWHRCPMAPGPGAAEGQAVDAPAMVPAWVDAQAPDVLLTLGAGDIDRLVPDLHPHHAAPRLMSQKPKKSLPHRGRTAVAVVRGGTPWRVRGTQRAPRRSPTWMSP